MAGLALDAGFRVIQGDALKVLRGMQDESVNCCVTSPPYWGLRDYGVPGQLGLEPTPELYTAHIVEVFREVRRVLRNDGTLWLNLGDSYATGGGKVGDCPGGGAQGERWAGRGMNTKQPKWATALGPICQPNRMPIAGLKPKDLVGIPWRVAFALQADGWYLRSDVIWSKGNPMPESVKDRPTRSHEYLFLLAKSQRYYYDSGAIAEARRPLQGSPYSSLDKAARSGIIGCSNGMRATTLRHRDSETRNRRTVWNVNPKPYKGAHFATFPPKLIEPCILAGAPKGGIVLDPFSGAGTTGIVALEHGRRYIGIELNPEYIAMSYARAS